ncbi:hypothetical protein IAU59_007604 [Kwoniella sp. CBS 9459]
MPWESSNPPAEAKSVRSELTDQYYGVPARPSGHEKRPPRQKAVGNLNALRGQFTSSTSTALGVSGRAIAARIQPAATSSSPSTQEATVFQWLDPTHHGQQDDSSVHDNEARAQDHPRLASSDHHLPDHSVPDVLELVPYGEGDTTDGDGNKTNPADQLEKEDAVRMTRGAVKRKAAEEKRDQDRKIQVTERSHEKKMAEEVQQKKDEEDKQRKQRKERLKKETSRKKQKRKEEEEEEDLIGSEDCYKCERSIFEVERERLDVDGRRKWNSMWKCSLETCKACG